MYPARPESILASLITGSWGHPSLLMTDAYKFSMAQAGFPLRPETFYFTLRRGGPHYIPVDLAELVRCLTPDPNLRASEHDFLRFHGYGMTPAMQQAVDQSVDIWCAPVKSWVLAGEPIITVTGPSFLVSWLEPLIISLHYIIQVATDLKRGVGLIRVNSVTERKMVEVIADSMDLHTKIEEATLRSFTEANARELRDLIGSRAFEVGMRGVSNQVDHLDTLDCLSGFNIRQTSSLFGAHRLHLTPVGTTGHEHQMRWGDDLTAFRAMRDMRPDAPSYLFDTYNALAKGLPAAAQVMREMPSRSCAIRFDSGDQDIQLQTFLRLNRGGAEPRFIFEDGYTAERVRENEKYIRSLRVLPERALYGFGGYLSPSYYPRDAVSAVYKLTESNGPRMKFSASEGKSSIPGHPVIFRREPGRTDLPFGMIGQLGEPVPSGYYQLTVCQGVGTFIANEVPPADSVTEKSPLTLSLIETIKASR